MSVSSEERILRFLKFRGRQTAETIARHLDISVPGARKHLDRMKAAELVDFEDEAGAVGRPRRFFLLAEKAGARFPDTHAELTLDMIGSVRRLFGADGLDRLIEDRERRTDDRYAEALKEADGIEARLDRMAALRSEEGYLAEWERLPDGGGYLLVENHCPICAAARACQGFCRSELESFRRAFAPLASVERAEHMLAGSRRCAYLVRPRGDDAA